MEKKNYLIIGGSSGIGLAIVQNLVEQGHQVWVASRNKSPELEKLNVQHTTWNVQEPVSTRFENLPELHGLAYCPGTINLKPFHRLTREDFLQDLQINVLGAIEALQATYKQLKNAQNSSVVLFSTVASTLGMNFHSSIATAKGALEGLAKSLAAEWASQNIRVNVIAPSLTDTPLASKLLSDDTKREAAAKRHPLGKFGNVQDIAQMACFLLSEKASWITGQIIGIDGGMSTLKP
ncbi:MAG: SDR family oxidoreductase [Raineya sp.]|nr:SDR family oxidoreductase [Raineya sp.]MDW8295622.1 SDR family oxidoreductase [Raineya sp.]